MLQIKVPKSDFWDPAQEMFVYTDECTLQLEHSLVSISKWESNWEKPFFGLEARTTQETIDYIQCMTINKNVDPNVYLAIANSPELISKINTYIERPMTATTFSDDKNQKGTGRGRVITSEEIYQWMIAFNVPFDPCQKWHIQRLLTLLRVCAEKNKPAKKMSTKDIARNYKEENARRKAKLNTKG